MRIIKPKTDTLFLAVGKYTRVFTIDLKGTFKGWCHRALRVVFIWVRQDVHANCSLRVTNTSTESIHTLTSIAHTLARVCRHKITCDSHAHEHIYRPPNTYTQRFPGQVVQRYAVASSVVCAHERSDAASRRPRHLPGEPDGKRAYIHRVSNDCIHARACACL